VTLKRNNRRRSRDGGGGQSDGNSSSNGGSNGGSNNNQVARGRRFVKKDAVGGEQQQLDTAIESKLAMSLGSAAIRGGSGADLASGPTLSQANGVGGGSEICLRWHSPRSADSRRPTALPRLRIQKQQMMTQRRWRRGKASRHELPRVGFWHAGRARPRRRAPVPLVCANISGGMRTPQGPGPRFLFSVPSSCLTAAHNSTQKKITNTNRNWISILDFSWSLGSWWVLNRAAAFYAKAMSIRYNRGHLHAKGYTLTNLSVGSYT
jgi:hypothetical protein